MSFENSIPKLPANKALELESAIIEIGLALLGGGKPYKYINLKKNKHIVSPTLRKVFEDLSDAESERLVSMVDVFLNGCK